MEIIAKSDSDSILADIGRAIRLILLEILQSICCCCDLINPATTWTFKRATEPTDINWENLGIGIIRRYIQTALVYIATTIILVLCGAMIYAIK